MFKTGKSYVVTVNVRKHVGTVTITIAVTTGSHPHYIRVIYKVLKDSEALYIARKGTPSMLSDSFDDMHTYFHRVRFSFLSAELRMKSMLILQMPLGSTE